MTDTTDQPTATPDAVSLLVDAADTLTERGKQRDQPTGERSMGRCVRAFNELFGQHLTEQQGWQFMALLKIARSAAGELRLDDYIDQAGYAALAGECAARVQMQPLRRRLDDVVADAAIDKVQTLLARKRHGGTGSVAYDQQVIADVALALAAGPTPGSHRP
jgi:hypothetical protein